MGEINNSVTYIDPNNIWITSDGALNINLYLHLIEKGNEKLGKAITIPFTVGSLKQQQPKHHYKNQQQEPRREHQQKKPTTPTEMLTISTRKPIRSPRIKIIKKFNK